MLADLSHFLLGRVFWYPNSDENEALVRQVLERNVATASPCCERL
ncbi:hypothetical protein [Bradyrhizobium sp. WSM1417]|nr:hypothetical protein [Bradyrhizobium sp. WSM1417]